MTRALWIVCIVLAGCAHPLTLIPRDGGVSGAGEANEVDKSVTITVGEKVFKGTYVYSGGTVISTSTYGTATAHSGTRTATGFGSSTSTTYVPGSGNGKVLAVSSTGGTLRCDFQYASGTGIGYCQDNTGREYDLLIK